MNRYRMIALDIDGTILNSRGELTPRLQHAVARATQSGVAVTLATGRSWRAALPVAQALGIDRPLVVQNGAVVRAAGTQLALEFQPLHRRIAVAAVQSLIRLGFAPVVRTAAVEGPDLFYEQAPTLAESASLITREPQHARQVFDLAGLAAAVDTMKVMAIDREASIATSGDRLRSEFGDRASIIVTLEAPGYALLEVSAPGISKATGLASLAQMYRIRPDEVIAFGDNFNDLEMLQWAGLGVAMGNAPAAVKAVAGAITATNDDDGVAQLLERLGFRAA